MTQYSTWQAIDRWLSERIIGQSQLTNRLLIALLADGHLLVEGAPGLAKTTAIKTLSEALDGSFHRVQFTPDLLPGDITGSEIYRQERGEFQFQPGPVFHNLLLADEINRAPAKVQSALLEAMAERQISVGSRSYPLPPVFLVMATQNPIEQEGTYPLPEAQLDRFLLHVAVGYPSAEDELRILALARQQDQHQLPPAPHRLSVEDLQQARQQMHSLHLAPALERYLVALIDATRRPAAYDAQLARWLPYGVSPRGTLALERCARAHAWLQGRDYVSPDDIQGLAADCLRHRLLLSYEAEANGVTRDQIIQRLLEVVAVP